MELSPSEMLLQSSCDRPRRQESEGTMATAIDPVCGMTVEIETAKHTLVYEGTTYYFCGKGCKTAFDKEPEKYLAAKPKH